LRIVVKVLDKPNSEDILWIRWTTWEKASSEKLSGFLLSPINRTAGARSVANINIVNFVEGDEVQVEAGVGGGMTTFLSIVTQRDGVWCTQDAAQQIAPEVSHGKVIDFSPVSDKVLMEVDEALLAAWLVLEAISTPCISLSPATRAIFVDSPVSMELKEDLFKLRLMFYEFS
jgi:hypothetical protein